jgi:hypothetical protein
MHLAIDRLYVVLGVTGVVEDGSGVVIQAGGAPFE